MKFEVKVKKSRLKSAGKKFLNFFTAGMTTLGLVTNVWAQAGEQLKQELESTGKGVASFLTLLGSGVIVGLYLILVVAGFGIVCYLSYRQYKQAQREHENATQSAIITFLLGLAVYLTIIGAIYTGFNEATNGAFASWISSISPFR